MESFAREGTQGPQGNQHLRTVVPRQACPAIAAHGRYPTADSALESAYIEAPERLWERKMLSD
jgi:hypothetical protein